MAATKHPSFVRAETLPEPLRAHFPKSVEEAQRFFYVRSHLNAVCMRVISCLTQRNTVAPGRWSCISLHL